jgi:branched-chain amino acid aminotransferase
MATAAKYMCMNGEIVAYENCRVHAFSNAVKYGAGLFEGLRGYWNEKDSELYLFRLREHWDRFRYGMRVMQFDRVFDDGYLTDCVLRTVRANDIRENVHIRVIAFLDCDEELPACGPVGLVVGAMAKPRAAAVAKGINVVVSSWTRVADNALPPRVKACANYINNRCADLEARRHGYDTALMLTTDGRISEGATSCFFMVRKGVLITPDVSSGILESVTRDTLISIARDRLRIPVQERAIDRTEIYAADEAFLCASAIEVRPVVSIDQMPVGGGQVGAVTRALQDNYFELVRGGTGDHPEWRTPAYRPKPKAAPE